MMEIVCPKQKLEKEFNVRKWNGNGDIVSCASKLISAKLVDFLTPDFVSQNQINLNGHIYWEAAKHLLHGSESTEAVRRKTFECEDLICMQKNMFSRCVDVFVSRNRDSFAYIDTTSVYD